MTAGLAKASPPFVDERLDQGGEPFAAPPLPYEYDALVPVLSAETLRLHHLKHHQGYADKLNELIASSDLRGSSLHEILFATAGDTKRAKIFNNAAQLWNHTFYWHSMRPRGGGRPGGDLARRIAADFGSEEELLAALKKAAVEQFGSGWAWLVLDGASLRVVATSNAETPLVARKPPLLAIDVWEHAYYLDYQNRRPDYAGAWLDHLVNWEFAAANLARAAVG